jgi:hypothetical protein
MMNHVGKILQPFMMPYLFLSHAIASYLVRSYASDDSLYPQDPKQKAIVDQRLYFDAGILFPRLREICVSINVAVAPFPLLPDFSVFFCEMYHLRESSLLP